MPLMRLFFLLDEIYNSFFNYFRVQNLVNVVNDLLWEGALFDEGGLANTRRFQPCCDGIVLGGRLLVPF